MAGALRTAQRLSCQANNDVSLTAEVAAKTGSKAAGIVRCRKWHCKRARESYLPKSSLARSKNWLLRRPSILLQAVCQIPTSGDRIVMLRTNLHATKTLTRPCLARAALMLLTLIALASTLGCGITRSRIATEQMVVADAVDRAVAQVDFSPLAGQSVFFDTKYLPPKAAPSSAHGNVEYVISSLRQQMMSYDLRLQDKQEDADVIIEARLGVMGNDGNEVTYGVPGSAALGTASLIAGSPAAIPSLPELSLGRRNHQRGAAKLGVFAYDRATREPLWKAGVSSGSSEARDLWVLGLGPYQRGPVYGKARPKPIDRIFSTTPSSAFAESPALDAYQDATVFKRLEERQAAATAIAQQQNFAPVIKAELPSGEAAKQQSPIANSAPQQPMPAGPNVSPAGFIAPAAAPMPDSPGPQAAGMGGGN